MQLSPSSGPRHVREASSQLRVGTLPASPGRDSHGSTGWPAARSTRSMARVLRGSPDTHPQQLLASGETCSLQRGRLPTNRAAGTTWVRGTLLPARACISPQVRTRKRWLPRARSRARALPSFLCSAAAALCGRTPRRRGAEPCKRHSGPPVPCALGARAVALGWRAAAAQHAPCPARSRHARRRRRRGDQARPRGTRRSSGAGGRGRGEGVVARSHPRPAAAGAPRDPVGGDQARRHVPAAAWERGAPASRPRPSGSLGLRTPRRGPPERDPHRPPPRPTPGAPSGPSRPHAGAPGPSHPPPRGAREGAGRPSEGAWPPPRRAHALSPLTATCRAT